MSHQVNEPQKGDEPRGEVTSADYTASLLYIDARLHRNALGYANDPAGSSRTANAEAYEIVVGGWPHVIILSTRDIFPGDEILWEYGGGFWSSDEDFDEDSDEDSDSESD